MDLARVDAVKRLLGRQKLDALLLRLPENMLMACGAWPLNGFGFAFFTAEHGPHTLIVPEGERGEVDAFWGKEIKYFPTPIMGPFDPWREIGALVSETVRSLHLGKARIGYEDGFGCIAPAHNCAEITVPTAAGMESFRAWAPNAQFLPADEMIRELRAKKTSAEVQRLRIANEVASIGLAQFAESVTPGASEAELASAVYSACLSRGLERSGVRFINVYPQVSSGINSARAWRPIVQTGARRLKAGELALLELAVCVDGYWADVTRVRAAGTATDEQKRAYQTVREAQDVAVSSIRAGINACDVHERATEVLRAAGYTHEIRHLTGHGLGFSYHESIPMLWQDSPKPLEAGNVCSVEPGLYADAWGGIRIENNVLVTESGCEVLTLAPRTLI